jgi:hypothetical protein
MKKKKKYFEFCNHCGRPVHFGSGSFVNRVPDFNDVETRVANGLLFPLGDFVCDYCDTHSLTGNDETNETHWLSKML